MINSDVIDNEKTFRKRVDVKMYMTFNDNWGNTTYWINDDCNLSEHEFENSCRELDKALRARIVEGNQDMMEMDEDLAHREETCAELFVKKGVDEDGEIEWIER